ncbi:hypothetical protein RI844_15705 [Thalassotalea fonticola]|uniref:Uncharacterized protein n=1 Tax=Thalassotalea fonticola TaxID=3065649 RepID=A0ABZ0GML6_9GAMM|nr:hypothetical protein RI844_15705 [Colwelliaceae bacterium S1-1]
MDLKSVLTDGVSDFYSEKYQSALDKFVYFFDNTSESSEWAGVRLSFGLSTWGELAKVYPDAKDKLVARKNIALKEYNSDPTKEKFKTFASICRYLGLGNEVLDIFYQYHLSNKQYAQLTFDPTYEYLIEAERYSICAEYIDYSKKYEHVFYVFGRTDKVPLEIKLSHLKKALIPLFKILNLNPDSEIYAKYTQKLVKDLNKHDIQSLYVEIING